MSISPDEAWQEEQYEKWWKEQKAFARNEIPIDKYEEYLLKNPTFARASVSALNSSKELINIDSTSSFIYSAIAIEVGLKTVILKPLIFSYILSDPISENMSYIIIRYSNTNTYRNLLFEIIRDFTNFDLNVLKRNYCNKTLWDEIQDITKKRNNILHKAEKVGNKDAYQALDVAKELFTNIFSKMVGDFRFHIHVDGLVCRKSDCLVQKLF